MNEQQTEELYLILGQLIQAYTKGQTTQVPVEVADRIFQSVEYCIGLSKDNKEVQDSMIKAYQEGYRLGEECAQQTRKLWIKVKNSAVNVDNNSYRDTIWNGIGQFFDCYSLRYAANEIPKELSYPLANPVEGVSGILYVNRYLNSLLLENEFMAAFDLNEIRALLAGLDAQNPDLSLNLMEVILTNAIAHILLGQPVVTLDLTKEEQGRMAELIKCLTLADLQKQLEQAGEKLLTMLGLENNQKEQFYVQAALKRMSYQWSKEAKSGMAVKRFVSLNHDAEPAALSLSGSKMTESEWIECSFLLNQAVSLKERLHLLTVHVHHIEDLIRCFDYFAGEEYYTVFTLLNQQENEQLLEVVTQHLNIVEEEGRLASWEQALTEYIHKREA